MAAGECEWVCGRLSDHLDGRLPEGSEEAGRIGAHLKECAACARMLADFRAISRAAGALAREGVPDAERKRIGLRASERLVLFLTRRARRRTLGLLAAAAAAAVIGAIVFIGSREGEPEHRNEIVKQAPPPEEVHAAAVLPETKAPEESLSRAPSRDDIDRLVEELRASGPLPEVLWNLSVPDESRLLGRRAGTGPSGLREAPVSPPLLGVTVGSVLGSGEAPARREGALVLSVVTFSCADAMGLLPGDVIAAVNGKRLGPNGARELCEIVRGLGAGSEIGLTVLRGGRRVELPGRLGSGSGDF